MRSHRSICRPALIIVAALTLPQSAIAYCDPPIAPPMTSEDLAREYREEFKQDFEVYFLEAQSYLRCFDEERGQVMRELSETAVRYERFLNDSRQWESD